ncbi:MAG TPA: NAD-dependent epimerase/dehydratase family protein [Bacteroidales bacterium]|nr:NAD-dependent epimerase/dehydratase family protein [Bacteroidales bacterium]
MDKKILITGVTGLVGTHLAYSLLSQRAKVKATFRKNSKRELLKKVISYYSAEPEQLYSKIEWVECDLFDYESLMAIFKDVDMVYHCAAIVSFEKGDEEKIINNNVIATRNVVRACIENHISKLCHISSIAALGGSDGELNINEENIWNPSENHSPYSISKFLSEQEVWKGHSEGLKAVIVLPSIILGPGDWDRSSSAIFDTISKGLPFYTNGTKAYVDVQDVVKAMIMLMESDISGEKFIVTSENITNLQLFSLVAKNLGVKKPFLKIPKFLRPAVMPVVGLISLIKGKKLPITKDLLSAAWTKTGYDNSKIINKTGLTFTPISKSIERISSIYLRENKQL